MPVRRIIEGGLRSPFSLNAKRRQPERPARYRQTLQLAAARMGLVACSAPPPACQLPPALRARRFVMLMPLGIRENPGALYLSLEPPKGAIQAFVLANTDLRHPPPPPRHPGPAMTTWGTSDPPVGMNETSVIILRRWGGRFNGGFVRHPLSVLHTPHRTVVRPPHLPRTVDFFFMGPKVPGRTPLHTRTRTIALSPAVAHGPPEPCLRSTGLKPHRQLVLVLAARDHRLVAGDLRIPRQRAVQVVWMQEDTADLHGISDAPENAFHPRRRTTARAGTRVDTPRVTGC